MFYLPSLLKYRGPLVIRAAAIEKELEQVTKKKLQISKFSTIFPLFTSET